MGTGIIVCGLNGAGKSTLGRALAERLNFHFIDVENLYFPKTNSSYTYACARTREEVEELLLDEVRRYEDFVFCGVRCDYGEEFLSLVQYAVIISVPKDIRLARVKNRSFEKFGDRIQLGGDLYESEARFISMVEARPENYVDEWLRPLGFKKVYIDGTRPVDESVEVIIQKLGIENTQQFG